MHVSIIGIGLKGDRSSCGSNQNLFSIPPASKGASFFPFLIRIRVDVAFSDLPPIKFAEESAQSFSLPEGTNVKVWASEPMVQNPIAMAWDSLGRMWVAENYTYGSRKVRFDLSLRDRVIVLSDTDGDGQADTRKVFTDEVQMLTSVEVGHGGVWLMCPPKLLFIPDRDNPSSGRMDERRGCNREGI